MIEVKGVKKSFEGKEVLKGIDTVFHEGQTNMVIGTSGSGKTVLMKCIVGLIVPDSGQVLYDSRDIVHMKYKELRKVRREIGMLFQGAALFGSLTVEENVGFPLKLFTKMTKKEIKDRVDFCLDRVNINDAHKKYPDELSGGMKKRVGIARAITLNPKYLFCDEPNSGLDPQTSTVIDSLINEITLEFNTTTIINTHDMNSVLEHGDHIIFLHKGRKHWEGSKKEIREADDEILKEFIYASEFIREQYGSTKK